jgi:xylose isomerase
MMVVVSAGGFKTGGINFDAKTRRNSTDLADIFHAHIGGMDTFARALMIANEVLTNSEYPKLMTNRYKSFDSGNGKKFEKGGLSIDDLRKLALKNGEPEQISGRQEYFENIINKYI